MAFGTRSRSNSSSPAAGIIFGVIWTLFSSIFLVLGLWITFKGVSYMTWKKVPCVIEKFEIAADSKKDTPFQPDVSFRYYWEGQEYHGTRLWPDKKDATDYADLSEPLEMLRIQLGRDALKGATTECRVNPHDPKESSLLGPTGSSWGGLIFAAMGGTFVMIGLALIRSSFRNKKRKALSDGGGDEPIKEGSLVLFLVFGLFGLAGAGILAGLVLPTAYRKFESRNWVATPAKVIWSRVVSKSDSDGTTYKVDIHYRYQFQGREYRSNRYSLIGGSSSGRDSKQAVVKAHPANSNFTCYVNPKKPWEALVTRDIGAMGFFALFPLPFLGIGIWGTLHTLRKRREAKTGKTANPLETLPEADQEEIRLHGGKKRWHSLIGSLIGAIFWNGIVSVFVVIAWKSWQRHDPEWFLTIFMIPFVLIGIALLVNIPYQILRLCGPIFELKLSPAPLAPGGEGTLTWVRCGGRGKVRRLVFHLVGIESASYRNGSSNSTATSVFHEELLTEIFMPEEHSDAPLKVKIPADAMPSFPGKNNQIIWKIRVLAEVPRLPAIRDEHDIQVRPLRREELNA